MGTAISYGEENIENDEWYDYKNIWKAPLNSSYYQGGNIYLERHDGQRHFR